MVGIGGRLAVCPTRASAQGSRFALRFGEKRVQPENGLPEGLVKGIESDIRLKRVESKPALERQSAFFKWITAHRQALSASGLEEGIHLFDQIQRIAGQGKSKRSSLVSELTLMRMGFLNYPKQNPAAQTAFQQIHQYFNTALGRVEKPQDSPVMQRLKQALIAAAAEDTAYDKAAYRKRSHPIEGHCKAVAHVLENLLGGVIVRGMVDGETHFFNRVQNGTMLDMSNEQYSADRTRYNGYTPVTTNFRIVAPTKDINPRFKTYFSRVLTAYLSSLEQSLEQTP